MILQSESYCETEQPFVWAEFIPDVQTPHSFVILEAVFAANPSTKNEKIV